MQLKCWNLFSFKSYYEWWFVCIIPTGDTQFVHVRMVFYDTKCLRAGLRHHHHHRNQQQQQKKRQQNTNINRNRTSSNSIYSLTHSDFEYKKLKHLSFYTYNRTIFVNTLLTLNLCFAVRFLSHRKLHFLWCLYSVFNFFLVYLSSLLNIHSILCLILDVRKMVFFLFGRAKTNRISTKIAHCSLENRILHFVRFSLKYCIMFCNKK